MDILSITQQLKMHLSLDELSIDQNTNTQLVFNDDREINIELSADGERLHIYMDYGPLHHIEVSQRNAFLLEANFFTHETLGSTFSSSSKTQNVILSRCVPLKGLDPHQFIEIFDDFFNATEYWQKTFTEFSTKMTPNSGNNHDIKGAIYA